MIQWKTKHAALENAWRQEKPADRSTKPPASFACGSPFKQPAS
ncbi:hypothetical protein OZL46_08010 [Bacillus sonorensis]|nr:hypothetical protein [Bacillus sonorensis]MCZ0094767.1 hypothetical protein [Bacillus sonorensis]